MRIPKSDSAVIRIMRPDGGLTFNAKLTILERELLVSSLILASLLDRRGGTEADWSRLTLALHRIQALRGGL